MKSPFPGMDPFIEASALWGDFHDALIQEIKNALAGALPDRYLVRTGERGYVVLENESARRSFIPDVSVTTSKGTQTPGGNVALAEPTTEDEAYSLRVLVEENHREAYIDILDSNEDQRLVTSIEILSPSNKRPNSEGWEQYQRKRQAFFNRGSASLVEIDLLRGGERMPMAGPWHESPYRLLVFRGGLAPISRVWSGHFQKRLPPIPVPLLKPDPDVFLDLQPMIDAIYTRYKYWRSIEYAKPINPPLSAEDTAWLQDRLRELT